MTHVVVVGGGIGGLIAGLRARQLGADVTLIEAREQLGGLASAVHADGLTFDGGPYILLDRVRLAWALNQVGIDLDRMAMTSLDPAYQIDSPRYSGLTVFSDVERTVESIESIDPGMGRNYRRFVSRASAALEQLAPVFLRPHDLVQDVREGAWRVAPWALRSLAQIMRSNQLEGAAADAVRIWTAIAGGDPRRAPGPLALVPALIHRDGAARPVGGIHHLVTHVVDQLERRGVNVIKSSPVTAITHTAAGVTGVRLEGGQEVDADIVISDVGGAAALLDLVDAPVPRSLQLRMAGKLQSPGLIAYMRVTGQPTSEVRFRISDDASTAVACIVSDTGPDSDGTRPQTRTARLVTPLGHDRARALGEQGQRNLLNTMVQDSWWQAGISDVDVVATRLVGDWGRTFRLRDDAMNLVMARRQMLLGRLPHKVKHVPGLFLTGSWTHPGQWISFCSVSGVLAADAALATA